MKIYATRIVLFSVFSGVTSMASAADSVSALTWNGITLYGTVDAGYVYQTHGTSLNDSYGPGLEYMPQKNSNSSVSSLGPNGLSQSKIGVKGDIPLEAGWTALFKLEAGFSPLSGDLADHLKAMTENNGVALGSQSSNADSSRAGQIFSGAAYGGVSSTSYGTVTVGWQNSVLLDDILKYDPQGGSYAFSPIGFSGVAAGSGSSEDARLGSSVRYLNKFGPVRVDAEYQSSDNSQGGEAYEFDLGTDYEGLSIDATAVDKKQAISATNLSVKPAGNGWSALGAGTYSEDNSLNATVSDNTSYSLMAKYHVGVTSIYAGYENIHFANPSASISAGYTTIGGYNLAFVNNGAYATDKVLQIEWVGVKYFITPKLDVTGAYYHYDQNSYTGNSCALPKLGEITSACNSGGLDALSLVADYQYNKYVDVYTGAIRYGLSGGLSSDYLQTSTVDVMVGARFRF